MFYFTIKKLFGNNLVTLTFSKLYFSITIKLFRVFKDVPYIGYFIKTC